MKMKILRSCAILFQGTAVVPLIKFFSFLCLLLGFALFALHMEFHPSFTTAWFSNALDEPLDIGTLDWGPETTKQTDVKREGSTGGKFIANMKEVRNKYCSKIQLGTLT